MGGLTVPFYVWSYLYNHKGAEMWTIFIPLAWFVSISMSRLYLVSTASWFCYTRGQLLTWLYFQGVHSPADCLCGFVLGAGIFWWYEAWDIGNQLEEFLHESPFAVHTVLSLTLLSMFVYPRPDYWVSSFGDTYVRQCECDGENHTENLHTGRLLSGCWPGR